MARKAFLCIALLLAVLSARSAILYVRADAAGPETNGLSWATAFNTITQALQHATSDDELWVTAGTYKGAVEVPAGVALYGGFAGNETARTQRDWARNRSVIDWDELRDLYPSEFLLPAPAVSLGNSARLDGFTVINGWHSHGAGVYASQSGATIANNIIVTNRATGILPSAVLVDRPGHLTAGDDFFLKTANDLLHLQFPFGATNIPVAQYTPAVHRLLQVAANIYDAARSNTFPSVFRPQFVSTPDGPIISGYDQDDSAANVAQWLTANPYGIPMIIGARKGFPNFNELALDTIVFVTRRLELHRYDTNSPPSQTNEMYVIGISNTVGVELWNSYTQAFGHDVQITISNVWSFDLYNTEGIATRQTSVSGVVSNVPAGSWSGFRFPFSYHPTNYASFTVPLLRRDTVLPLSAYHFGLPGFVETPPSLFEADSRFHIPDWQLLISNRLMVLVSSGQKIIDLVLLNNVTNIVKLTDHFFQTTSPTLNEGPIAICWRTNRTGTSTFVPTEGIRAQLDISLGQVPTSPSQWQTFNFEPLPDRQSAISNFVKFVFPYVSGDNTNLIQIAPFSPARKLLISARWEANDPLVHALAEDLRDVATNYLLGLIKPFTGVSVTNSTLGNLNLRYNPWGGRPGRSPRPEDVDRRLKDSGFWSANEFNSPSGSDVNIDWLDRIHRGTPWQTLYFDRDVAPMNVWMRQSLDPATHPTNDWKIIEYLRAQIVYSGSPTPTRVVNNTIVANEGGVWIATNAAASVMNNVVADNLGGIVDEGGSSVELSANCVLCSPQFVNAAIGDYSVLATSPLIDAGDARALAWTERPVLGAAVDIGALEFGPDGVPVFTFQRTSPTEYALALRGFSGQSYVVEASTNLVNWSAITTNIAVMGNILLQDADGTNYSHRFYRAKVANHPN